MFDEDDDFFGLVPDFDGDGDHDFVDFLIMDEIFSEEETDDDDAFSNDDDWRENVEDDDEELVNPYDYDTEDEYFEALNKVKYEWREEAEDGSMYDLDAEDFDTAEEYEDALEEARRQANEDSNTIGSELEVEDKSKDDRAVPLGAYVASTLSNGIVIEDSIKENTSGKPNYKCIIMRKNQAKEILKDNTYGEDITRCKFIVNDKSMAARYLTVDGEFLYSQAVKDHFKLPFEIPDETDRINTYFETLLQDLVENDVDQAMRIWEWCLDTFMPYKQYVSSKNHLPYNIVEKMYSFIEEFPNHIVDYMVKRPVFIEKLIQPCTHSLMCIKDLVIIALKAEKIEIAKRIMECAFTNPYTTVADKVRFIECCIENCSDWKEVETMEAFQQHVFPIVFTQKDARIINKISRWQKEMAQYIAHVEENSDLYVYSRLNAWRDKYRDAEVSPVVYNSEEEYLEEVKAIKYGWREYCQTQYGISPNDYETRSEFDAAIKAEYKKQKQAREKEFEAMLKDTTLYKFCKVSLNYPEKPHYYFLTGELELKVGDRVKVPFGQDNILIDAVIIAIGECYGSSFPFPISKLKKVIKKA